MLANIKWRAKNQLRTILAHLWFRENLFPPGMLDLTWNPTWVCIPKVYGFTELTNEVQHQVKVFALGRRYQWNTNCE